MRKLFREPLLHFLILGAALFGLYGWLQGGALSERSQIVVSRDQLQSLAAQFQRVWQRPPTPEELQGLMDNWVREEIFYREGMTLGLDRDDPVVRRRIGQKVEFIVDGLAPAKPTTAELQAWLDAHAGDYADDPVYSLQQLYFDPSRRGAHLDAEMASARRALELGRPAHGDDTMLPAELNAASAAEVTKTFGTGFADALEAMPLGTWQGPVRSGFGLHLVRLTARQQGRKAQLEEIRADVERDLLHARTQEAADAFYRLLRARYVVRVDVATTAAN